MDSVGKTDANDLRSQLMMAKILLRKYGCLHDFHIRQLENYPIACCKISLAGDVEVDAENKKVTFKIKTSRKYKLNGDEVIERQKYSVIGKWNTSDAEYKEQIEFAKINLNTWTKELLWGPETNVKVTVDGLEIS